MILVTPVWWGLGVARVSAVESVFTNGEPQSAETHPPLLLPLGQMEEAKLGGFMWVLKNKLRPSCFRSQDFTELTPSLRLLFFFSHEITSWELKTGKAPEKSI